MNFLDHTVVLHLKERKGRVFI